MEAQETGRPSDLPRPDFRKDFLAQILRFGVVGVMNTAVGVAAVYVNVFLFGMDEISGNLLGYIFGLLFGFSFHRNWTFRATNSAASGLFKYAFAFIIAYGANLGCVLALRNHGVGAALAHAIGVVPYVIIFFLMSRYVVFVKESPR